MFYSNLQKFNNVSAFLWNATLGLFAAYEGNKAQNKFSYIV